MKVTVTGAAGTLGAQTLNLLWENGYEVHATDQNFRRDLPVRLEIASLLNRERCYDLLAGSDAVVHLGNHSSFHGNDRQRIFFENTTMDMNVFQAAVDVGIKKIVFSSSIQSIGKWLPDPESGTPGSPAYLPLDGAIPPRPANPYALSKEAGENMLRYFTDISGITGFSVRFPYLLNQEMRARLQEHPDALDWLGAPNAFAWLDIRDAAALIDALLRSDLTGHHTFMPSAPLFSGESVAELSARLFPGVPWKTPVEKATSFIDMTGIMEATDWEPAFLDPMSE